MRTKEHVGVKRQKELNHESVKGQTKGKVKVKGKIRVFGLKMNDLVLNGCGNLSKYG